MPSDRLSSQHRAARSRRAQRAEPLANERLEGLQCVREALRAERRRALRLTIAPGPASSALDEICALAQGRGVPVTRAEGQAPARRGRGPGANTQRVALEVSPFPLSTLEQLAAGPSPRLLVALDGVQDPQNVGAIARVAEAAGASGLVLPERRSAPPTPAVSRASAGALEWLLVARVSNLTRALADLTKSGFWSVGAVAEGAPSLYETPDRTLRGDLVVVLGGEATGLRRGTLERVDHPLRIPMRGEVASLNVATAAAALLFEIRRRWDGIGWKK